MLPGYTWSSGPRVPILVHHLELHQAPERPPLPLTPPGPLCPARPWNWGGPQGCLEFLVCLLRTPSRGQGLGLELL